MTFLLKEKAKITSDVLFYAVEGGCKDSFEESTSKRYFDIIDAILFATGNAFVNAVNTRDGIYHGQTVLYVACSFKRFDFMKKLLLHTISLCIAWGR